MKNENTGFFSFLDHITFVEDDSSSYEIGIGDEGFSYLDLVSEKRAKQLTFEEKQGRATSAALDGSTRARGKLNIRKVETIDHDAISLDTNLESIIRDFQNRKKKVALFPLGLSAFVILLLLWYFLLPNWMAQFLVGIWLFPLGFVGLWNLWKLDVSRRRATLKYRFSGSGQAAFDAINDCLGRLSNSQQVLMLTGFKHFEDTRYTGGADKLPEFKEMRLDRRSPPLIDIDSSVWHIRANRRDLYFMPDHLMIYDGANIGGIPYSNLELRSTVDATQAREVAKHTTDCKVVGTTYRFVNNDGSPDQRFNNNIDIPIVEYGVFCLAGSGLDMRLYASSQPAGASAARGFEAMQHLASKPVVSVAEKRRQDAVKHRQTENIFIVLLNALCCVMASDGRVSSSEKKRLIEIMTQVKSPLTREQVNDHVAHFLQRVKQDGFTSVVNVTCDELQIFKQNGKTNTLFSCLKAVAEADGVVADAERKIIERFRVALGE